tara:strand:- start:296 stop:424 length:129 start_codon:yes stop_codon:yes gene_type:complete
MTRIVSYVRAFDLYDFRSELRQYPGAIGAGDTAAYFEDAYAV